MGTLWKSLPCPLVGGDGEAAGDEEAAVVRELDGDEEATLVEQADISGGLRRTVLEDGPRRTLLVGKRDGLDERKWQNRARTSQARGFRYRGQMRRSRKAQQKRRKAKAERTDGPKG